MKTEKWMLAAAAAILLTNVSCDDWGEKDPPAGNQIYPSLQQAGAVDFETEEGLDPTWTATANAGGTAPAIIEDETTEKGGHVLEINSGYLALPNPLASLECQTAAGLTFWLYQPEAVETRADNAAVVAFVNGSDSFTISADGSLKYSGAEGNWSSSVALPADSLAAAQWNFYAISVKESGYELSLNGNRLVKQDVADFDMSKLVAFVNKAQTLTIGTPETSTRFLVDDLKTFRNEITDKEIRKPNLSGGAGGEFEVLDGEWLDAIGAPDCSTGWWTEFSPYFRIPEGATLKLGFENHTSGGGNWNNWNLCVATDDVRGGGDYYEYFVVRSDLYGWGGSYNGDNWTNEGYGDWDAFRADMEGAQVDLTIQRLGAEIYVTAEAVCPNGNVYKEMFHATCGDGKQIVRAFLIVDGSHLKMDASRCMLASQVPVETKTIGAADCSTGWWTEFSDYFQITPGATLQLKLENHTSGGGNWNNWNLCVCTDDERGGGDYYEYFVVRSDLYGWGGQYNGDNWTNEGYGDWDAFRADMEGADVTINIQRVGAEVYVTATAVCPNGNVYKEMFHATCGDGKQIVRAFLICDGSHLKMDTDNCLLFVPVKK